MIKIKNYIILLMVVLIGGVACEDMHDNYEQYLEETVYPGKVDSVSVRIGFQKLYLSWISPQDPKSESIVVKYGENDSVITHVDTTSLVVTGLTSGSGYDIEIFSIDELGNQSVKKYVSAMPLSQSWVESNIFIPQPRINPTDGINTDSLDFKWLGLNSDLMKYAGELSYTLLKDGAEVASGEATGDQAANGIEKITLKDLELEASYTLEYQLRTIPKLNGETILDTVTISKEYIFSPVDFRLPPIFMLAQSSGWDEASFIRFDAIAEGMYRASVDLKHGDVIRFFEKESMTEGKQFGYSNFLSEKIMFLEESDDGNDNLTFKHADGTYILTIDVFGKGIEVQGTVASAYLGLPGLVPGIVEAEHFDEGGNGVAYNDVTGKTGNLNLRPGEAVEIFNVGPIVIGWTGNGEWLTYTIAVLETGNYDISTVFAASKVPGILRFYIDGNEVGQTDMQSTGNWGSYATQPLDGGSVALTKGKHLLKVSLENPACNLDKFIFTKVE